MRLPSYDRRRTVAVAPNLDRRLLPGRALVGAVLVGGDSRRMGRDKALLDWGGVPLGRVVAGALRVLTPWVVMVGGGGRDYSAIGVPHLEDDSTLPGGGPMVGLLTVLRRFGRPVMLCGCDMPAIDPTIMARLVGWAAGAPAAAPVVDGRLQPLCGLYRPCVMPAALASLAGGSGRMRDLFVLAGARRIAATLLGEVDRVRTALSNVNDPEDLVRTRARIAG